MDSLSERELTGVQDFCVDADARCLAEVPDVGAVLPGQGAEQLLVYRGSLTEAGHYAPRGGQDDAQDTSPLLSS